MDKVFFPINIGGSHWTLVIAYIQEKKIQYRDALGAPGKKYTSAVRQYLIDEMRDKKGVVMTQAQQDEWVIEPTPDDTPQQENGYDCGMFVCMFADFILQNLPMKFTQADMPGLRIKLCYCILHGTLLYTA